MDQTNRKHTELLELFKDMTKGHCWDPFAFPTSIIK